MRVRVTVWLASQIAVPRPEKGARAQSGDQPQNQERLESRG